MVVEKSWLERIRSTSLFVYIFPEDPFELFDDKAGYYIAQEEVEPISVEAVEDLLMRLKLKEYVELRFASNLNPIRKRVLASSAHYSIIRFAYAEPWKGT
ncbi:hypothetical protein MALU111345_14320 [Marinicrinis lubricantis]